MSNGDNRQSDGKGKRYYTRAEMQARLDRRLEAIAAKTIGYISYLDTLTVTTLEAFENERALKNALWQTGPKGVFPWHSPIYDDGCQYHSMRVQSPTPATLVCIQYELNHHHISRGDVALDVICPSQHIADDVYEDLSSLFTQPRRGKRRMKRDQTVDFWAGKWARRNIAGYHDRLKVLDLPVAHFDVRLKGGPICRRRSLDHVANLEWFDIAEVLEKDLRLSLFNWKWAETAMRREAQRLARERRRSRRRGDPAEEDPVQVRETLWRRLFDEVGTEDLEKAWAQKIIDAAPWMSQAFFHAPALRFFSLLSDKESTNAKFTRNPVLLKSNRLQPPTPSKSPSAPSSPAPSTPAKPPYILPLRTPAHVPTHVPAIPVPSSIPMWKSPRWDKIKVAA